MTFPRPHRIRPIALAVAVVSLLLGQSESMAGRNEDVVSRIPVTEARNISTMQALSIPVLNQIDESARRIPEVTREIYELGSRALGDRRRNAQGRPTIHEYLENYLAELAPYGVERLGSIQGFAMAPTMHGDAPTLSVGQQTFEISTIYPNGVMPSLTPASGLEGHLVYVGNGEWSDLKGKPLDGAICLMNFKGSKSWERLFSLGARAVVVLEDEYVNRENAEGLFLNTPVPFPRYYVEKETADSLLELLPSAEPVAAKLLGGDIYARQKYESLFAYLPPKAPIEIELTPSSLLERIAVEAGADPNEILKLNPGIDLPLVAGQRIKLPDESSYLVKNADLITRLARDYGLAVDDVLEANNTEDRELSAISSLIIPNLETPIVLTVNIDSTSSVPHAPHGAVAASNLAIGLNTFEQLATSESMLRRRGTLLVLADGDVHGHGFTRRLLELWLKSENALDNKYAGSASRAEVYYEPVLDFINGSSEELNEDAAQWFSEDWLLSFIEKYRVEVAEQRVEVIRNQIDARNAGESEEEFIPQVEQLQQLIYVIADLRDSTIANDELDWVDRLRAFLEHPAFAEDAGITLPFTLREVRDSLRLQAEEAARNAAFKENNDELIEALKRVIRPGRIHFGYHLDFSDGSQTIGLKVNRRKGYRGKDGFKLHYISGLADRLRNVSAVAAVRGEWDQEFSFYSDKDSVDLTITDQIAVPYLPEFWNRLGVSLLPLSTLNDEQLRTDTPHDTIDRLNFENLIKQARTAQVVISAALESYIDSSVPPRLSNQEFGQITGRTLQFNIRSGIDAQEPVPGTWVYYPSLRKTFHVSDVNSSTHRGVRRGIVMETGSDGVFTLPLENVSYNVADSLPHIYAYKLDQDLGLITKVVNQGQVGTQKLKPSFALNEGIVLKKNLIMTDVYPLAFFTGSDPMDYEKIGRKDKQVMNVIDAILDGEPQHYAIDNPSAHYMEHGTITNVLYMQPGRRARITVNEGSIHRMILPGEVDAEAPLGRGIEVGPDEEGDPNISLPVTALEIARSMQDLGERRRDVYSQYGITDQAVNLALERSATKLAEAEQFIAERNWQDGIGSARESWGILVKLYPRLMQLGRDAVFSVIILMALLVPAVVFLEKLIIGAKSILGHLAGAVAMFIVGVLFLRFFHPAFQISVSPFIVMIAFIMILMSLVVLGICYQRFEVLLSRARAEGGEVDDGKPSLAATLSTALSLGVSNLKKRPSRTFLTALTVTVLTFSIVAFVSVRGKDSVSHKIIELDMESGGQIVDAQLPAYEGIAFREYFWGGMKDNFISALKTEFGGKYEITTRGYYLQREGGSGASSEGVNQVRLEKENSEHIVIGVMTFDYNEPNFSRIDNALLAGSWFKPVGVNASDRFQIIIPDLAARNLGITPEMMTDNLDTAPVIHMKKHDWKVVGILDTSEADKVRDINGKSLAMVDYVRSAFSSNISGELSSEPRSYHISWENLVAVPNDAAVDIRAQNRMVAIKLNENDDSEQFFQDIALRLNRTFFGYNDGQLSLITTKKEVSFGGLAKIIVPVILCILIVTNTMLGAVDERRGEVGMLGAIGLSPSQISFLLLSESLVFSVLGVVFGIFGGLAFANMVPFIAANFGGLFGGLSFNFTSIISMALAMGTGLVVMLATLLPARKAASLAAPSGMEKWSLPEPDSEGRIRFELPFTLTRGNAVGMLSFFGQFLENHKDATSEGFNCRNVISGLSEDGTRLEIQADMWLSPYDLDVAQEMKLRMEPGENEGVAIVVLDLTRQSGTEEAWLRTNYGFLDMVRLQFLIWRNMKPEQRQKYIERGRIDLSAADISGGRPQHA